MRSYSGTEVDHAAAAEVAAEVGGVVCSNCNRPVTPVKGLLWICTPECYLDWFHWLLGLPR
jgi:hypothetical protein